MKPPPKAVLDSFGELRGQLAGAVASLLFDGRDSEEALRVGDEILEDCWRRMAAVRGNRPPTMPPSWEDLRLSWAATLRACLERLERKE